MRPVALLLVLSVLGAGGWYGWKTWYAPDAARERVTTAAVQRGDLEDAITATGTLQPRDFVDVGTQVSGQLKVLRVAVGATVKAGDLLAEIDPTVFQSRVDADQAQLRNQQAQLADKQSQLALAELQQERQRGLMSENATTAEALQGAEAAVRSLTAQIASIRAQMQQTESSLRGDEANLSYTKIYAPMTGTVASLPAKQGQTLNANQQAPTLLRVADLSIMTVQAQVSEADIPKLTPGMEVYFTTLGGDGRRWYGKLRQINPTPAIVNNVVLYDALFDVPNTTGELMTQMTAQVFFIAASAKDALYVPITALRPAGGEGRRRAGPGADPRGLFAGGRAMVRVAREDGSFEERQVKVGMMNRVSAQILEGLEAFEQVQTNARGSGASGRRWIGLLDSRSVRRLGLGLGFGLAVGLGL